VEVRVDRARVVDLDLDVERLPRRDREVDGLDLAAGGGCEEERKQDRGGMLHPRATIPRRRAAGQGAAPR
jgi:hypothetical protein